MHCPGPGFFFKCFMSKEFLELVKSNFDTVRFSGQVPRLAISPRDGDLLLVFGIRKGL